MSIFLRQETDYKKKNTVYGQYGYKKNNSFYDDADYVEETEPEQKIRIQRNWENLMNPKYSKPEEVIQAKNSMYEHNGKVTTNYAEQSTQYIAEQKMETVKFAPENVQRAVNFADEDIRPTSTTMQFGNDGKETVFKDMKNQKGKQTATYKLNAKGKALVIFYALAVLVVLTLIILNTGVLSVLKGETVAKAETLAEKQEEIVGIYDKIEEISSDEYVIKVAQEELNMVKLG